MWFLLACTAPAPDSGPPPVECPETTPPEQLPPPTTVLLVSIDTVNRAFLGTYGDWDVTPRLNALFAEGTLLDHAVASRGLSGPAIASLLTGAYPRTHGVRENADSEDSEGIVDGVATLGERFAAAGYHTFGYSANQCYLLDDEMETLCTWSDPTLSQVEGDDTLTEGLIAALQGLPADEPTFAWLHYMEPHHDYVAHEPWFSSFHPEAYEGPWRDDMDAAIADYNDGKLAFTAADRAYVEAVYASQVAAVDDRIGQVLDALEAMGRLDDTVVAFAIDHGEALGRRGTYFFHGCSPYTEVLDVRFALWAPGRIPPQVIDSYVPSVDFAPTIAELSGLAWDGPAEGRSLLADLRTCTEPRRTAHFERGTETAGTIEDGWAYIFTPEGGFSACEGYSDASPYPNAVSELYDLRLDPLEMVNRAEHEPKRTEDMRQVTCDWVKDGVWANGTSNSLITSCW